MKRKETVLVTGASGFIGSHLTQQLSKDDYNVVGIYNTKDHLKRLQSVIGDGECRRVDLRDVTNIDNLFQEYNFTLVFHVAACGVRAELDNDNDVVTVNIQGTAALARAASRHNVRRFIYVGSGFEYRPQDTPTNETTQLEPVNFYGASKAAAWILLDTMCRTEELTLVTLRPFSVYGPGEHASRFVPYVINNALRKQPMQLTSGFQVRDYVFVKDVVQALIRGAEYPQGGCRVYNIGCGPEWSCNIRKVVEIILRLTEAPKSLAEYGTRSRPRSEPDYFVADISRAREQLEWQADTTLEEGLRQTIDWYQDCYQQNWMRA